MRLIMTDGARIVDVRIKGSGPKSLRSAERAARRLWRSTATATPRRDALPFGFTACTDLQLAVHDDEDA